MALPGRLPEVRAPARRRELEPRHASSRPPTPDEPLDALDRDDGSVAAVLDEAEDFLNSIGAQVLAEVQAEQGKSKAGAKCKRIFRRKQKSRRPTLGSRREPPVGWAPPGAGTAPGSRVRSP